MELHNPMRTIHQNPLNQLARGSQPTLPRSRMLRTPTEHNGGGFWDRVVGWTKRPFSSGPPPLTSLWASAGRVQQSTRVGSTVPTRAPKKNYFAHCGGLSRLRAFATGGEGGISCQVKFAVVNFAVGNFAEPRGFCVANFTVVNFAGTPRNVDVCRASLELDIQ